MSFDAIIVPGAGVRQGGEVPPWVSRRLDHAIKRQTGEPIILLSGGTVHKPPPLDPRGFPYFESHAGARYLLNHGIPAGQILTEIMSWETIGNAYFAKLIHVDPIQARNLLLINSEFHTERCQEVFRWVYSLDADRTYHWTFETVPDRDTMPEDLWEIRMEKERKGIESLQALKSRIQNLQDFRQWLFTQHGSYKPVPEFKDKQTGRVFDTY